MAFALPRNTTDVDQGGGGSENDEDDVFHIHNKPKLGELRKWRKATLALNASRRFRYTLDLHEIIGDDRLKNGELAISRFRAATHALRAVQRFEKAGRRVDEGLIPAGVGIGPSRLKQLMQDQQIGALEELGGVVGLAKLLKSSVERGIEDDGTEFEKRKNAFGTNRIPSKPGKGFWRFVWEAAHDTTLIILMVCAVVSLAVEMWSDGPKEGWYDGVSIAAAVIIVIVVTATSDYRQSLQFRSLSEEKRNVQVEVIREGRRCKISVFDVVVGDIVPINIGDQVPADGIFVSGQSLSIDESSMTGESMPVYKDAKQPFLLSGCKVVDGYGTMLVMAVGTNTEWGQVMMTLSEETGEETPLQVRLNGAATFIGQVGLTVAVVVFVILFIRFFAVNYKDNKAASAVLKRLVKIFAIAVTIVVVAVPEGLPLAVTLTLAYSMRKMMRDKSMVRNLAACETMGSATTICSDKTGTLTLNQMTVVQSWVADELREPEDVSKLGKELYETLLVGICMNSSGSVFAPKDGGKAEVSGSPTEAAALSWGVEIGMNFEEIRHSTPIVHVETFNSQKKRAGVAVQRDNGVREAHWKGAAEMILEKSDSWLNKEGCRKVMTQDKAAELNTMIEGMAAQSLRCIAFAYRELEENEIPEADERKSWAIPDEHLIFMCVIGIKDPCRPGVREAVQKCINAKIKVRMVTGDGVLTAKAIAQECGILTEGGEVVEGRVFRQWDSEQLDFYLPRLDVMARSSPSDKLNLVRELKKRGDVVAVTGDGTNDAPALHDADVGLSMGISGTEVAKESSDIVILDDNFASIVKVVRWGRSVYANIQKFIQFQLTVNVTALVINFVAAITSGDVPLTAVQLLWVNLIMDTLGALALATEPPTDDLMDKTPVGRKEPLITNVMWRNLFTQAIFQIIVLLTINYGGKKIFGLEHKDNSTIRKNTIVFNAFVFCQVFNEVNSRRPEKKNIFEGLHKNRLFIGIIVVEVFFQFIIVQFLKKFATTRALTWLQWVICVAIGSVAWPLGFISKMFPVREKPYINTHRIRLNLRKVSRKKSSGANISLSTREIAGSKTTGQESGAPVPGTTESEELLSQAEIQHAHV